MPRQYPDYLKHSNDDTPVPTWAQVTRSREAPNHKVIAEIARILADTDDEQTARDVWETWPDNYRRSVALILDKIRHQGWLDAIGSIEGWPWDGGFYCWPRPTDRGTFAEVMSGMSGRGGPFIEARIGNGLFAYLNAFQHKAWRRGWMETDVATAALHVGLLADGRAEIHLDVFNALFIHGAPAEDLLRIPRLGVFNRRQYALHRCWEQSRFASHVRTSANLYHLMRDNVPLSF
ncbi:MAG: hypothetical protein ACJ74J_02895 [Blastocatellia bacterium]